LLLLVISTPLELLVVASNGKDPGNILLSAEDKGDLLALGLLIRSKLFLGVNRKGDAKGEFVKGDWGGVVPVGCRSLCLRRGLLLILVVV